MKSTRSTPNSIRHQKPFKTPPTLQHMAILLQNADHKLTGTALYLTLRAQRIKNEPLDQLLTRLCNTRWLPTDVELNKAVDATILSGKIVAKLGRLNSCVTRSLVLATILSDRSNISIQIGFRSPHMHGVEGHAWVLVDNKPIEFSRGETRFIQSHQIVRTIPVARFNPI